MKKGNLFIISGPSGAGKGTICERVRKASGAEVSVSVTTRKPRPGEKNGEAYHFISDSEFDDMIGSDGLLEYADVFGNRYGTPKQPVIDAVFAGKNIILEIDVQGAMQVKNTFPEGIFIFVLPPSLDVLRKRIINRGGELPDDVERRVSEAVREMEYLPEYHYVILNDDIDDAVRKMLSVMEAEGLKLTPRLAKTLIKAYRSEEDDNVTISIN